MHRFRSSIVAFFVMVLVDGASSAALGAAVAAHPLVPAAPECLARGAAAVRADPALLPAVYRGCEATLTTILTAAGTPPTTAARRGLFAVAVAHRFAPHGPSLAL